jgi:hypothetical protein
MAGWTRPRASRRRCGPSPGTGRRAGSRISTAPISS